MGDALPAEGGDLFSAFRPNLRLSSGWHSRCKACCVAATREWRERHPEHKLRRPRVAPAMKCVECGAAFEGRKDRLLCGARRCKDRRYARVHPDKLRIPVNSGHAGIVRDRRSPFNLAQTRQARLRAWSTPAHARIRGGFPDAPQRSAPLAGRWSGGSRAVRSPTGSAVAASHSPPGDRLTLL